MKRRWFTVLPHAFAGLSLMMCLTISGALWLGGWNQNQFHHLLGRWRYITSARSSVDDRLQIVLVHYWPTPIVGPPITDTAATSAWIDHLRGVQIDSGGFELHYWAEFGTNIAGNCVLLGKRVDLDMPFWAAAVIWLIVPAFVWGLLPIWRHRVKSIAKSQNPIEPPVLDQDLPCVHCGYNLRTLHSSAVCPECGAPVADSLMSNAQLAKSRPAWLRCLAAGNALLFQGRLFLAATYASLFQRSGGFVEEYVPAVWCAGAFIALYFAGIFLLTINEYPHSVQWSSALGLRKLAAASLIFLGAGVCYQAVRTITTPKPFGLMGSASIEWYWPPIMLLLSGWVLLCWCIAEEFHFLAKLADRLPDHFTARTCMIGGIGAAASSLLLLYAARTIVTQWQDFGAFWLIVALWFGFLALTGLANLDFAIRLIQLPRRAKRQASSLSAKTA